MEKKYLRIKAEAERSRACLPFFAHSRTTAFVLEMEIPLDVST
jgi:hypothetical protein